VAPTPLQQARILAVAVPAAMLAGAYAFQYVGGLFPCEMCYWQRWAHMAGLAFGIAAFAFRGLPDGGRAFVWLAALGIFASGAIGAWHAGVEAGIFEGATQCAAIAGGGGTAEEALAGILSAPLIRCDQVPWSFLAISMAGWNAILSIGLSLVILWLSLRRPRIRT
jgi:disulfide bond formation protein DsbB